MTLFTLGKRAAAMPGFVLAPGRSSAQFYCNKFLQNKDGAVGYKWPCQGVPVSLLSPALSGTCRGRMCMMALDQITNPNPRTNQPVTIAGVSETAIATVDVKFKAEKL